MGTQLKLTWIENKDKTKGVQITSNRGISYKCCFPAVLDIKELSGHLKCYEKGYDSVSRDDGDWKCNATVITQNESKLHFSDCYSWDDKAGAISFQREVTVAYADSKDIGFSTRFGLQEEGQHSLEAYDVFIPGIWYRKNENVVKHGFGSDPYDKCYYIRATRMALPYVQLFRPGAHESISIMHIGPTPDTGIKEESSEWLVDSSLQYPSLGIKAVPVPSIRYIYPGSEGEKNYIDTTTAWARRSHPLTGYVQHKYRLLIHVCEAEDAYESMKMEWRYYFNILSPKKITVDLEKNYKIGVELLDTYCQEYNGVMGIPFWATVPEGTVCDISFQMGFVGQQLQCAYHLMKYGFENHVEHMVEKGNKLVNFWVQSSASKSVIPKVWYDVFPDSFKADYPTYTRTVTDGMEGIINAYQITKRNNMENKKWLEFCIRYGNWLVKNQNTDGSFYRAYDDEGQPVHKGKYNTSNVIRFLVNLYWETKEVSYLDTALKAGEYSYETIYLPMQYVGGTADNDNTIDKEAGMIAVYAFMSLYDATGLEKWLKAASGAADFSETWTYAWTFPVKPHKGNAVFDRVDFTGLSLIATGHSHSDVMMAYMVFDYYRLYLYTGDKHYYEFACFLSAHTKQTTDWSGKLGHVYPGLIEESGEVALQYHNGLGRWLPWCTIAQIEPLTRLKEWFGCMDIEEIEKLDEQEKRERNLPGHSSWLR